MKFISSDEHKAGYARREYPDAYRIVRVDGGWAVFFTADEYETWKRQK